MRKANEFITDSIISKLVETRGGLDAVESSEELSKGRIVEERYVSYCGNIIAIHTIYWIPSGGITTAKHIYNHRDTVSSRSKDPLLATEGPSSPRD